jgi:enoyl-CoA hydratase
MSVAYIVEDRIAVVTVERPEVRNAIDRATADALLEAWRRFDTDGDADVGILTGAGGTFCSGADLTAFDLVDRPEGHLGMSRLVVGKPTIAAVEGHAVAGGLELALWCDLRVAARDSVFGCFERRFGVPLIDGGTQRLPRLIGMSQAMDVVLTGRPVGAEEAERMGFVNRVTEPGQALGVARNLAKLIADFPQETVRTDRRAMLEGSGLPIDQGLAIERALGISVLDVARRGAARFAAGHGRSGAGLGD